MREPIFDGWTCLVASVFAFLTGAVVGVFIGTWNP